MTTLIDYDFDGEMYEERDEDARIDAYHAGYACFQRGQPQPTHDADMAEGWDDAKRASWVRVELPARPEGYYHMPIGSFE